MGFLQAEKTMPQGGGSSQTFFSHPGDPNRVVGPDLLGGGAGWWGVLSVSDSGENLKSLIQLDLSFFGAS